MIKCGEGATAAGMHAGPEPIHHVPPSGQGDRGFYARECVVEVIRQLRFSVVFVSHPC
ncbi:hypothetical protein AG1IA_06959 [Rhizoctonia solani AG-1 IA]|uniref:Uncharacterized protein n=1 Tax=Thanatephorus cucumeris (strain AG1-IA) TaxID=983506 RepID=L8WQE6_THACA|nr:hypothetical protein AG1IA_06959 [Rhizoctonia solani AG-1 IA]